MFCVPQISVRFNNIAKSHRALLKNFLSFWREHHDTLLNSDIYVEGVDANYTLAKAQNGGESVAVLYQNSVLRLDEGQTTYAFNSIGKDGIYIENSENVSFELYDMFGEKYAEGILKVGVNRLDLKNCGMAKLKSL
jgi:alpha-galactosidase